MNNKRVTLLDFIRGVAVFGILLMNIRLFAEPQAAYFSPLTFGNYEGLSKFWWDFQYLFADLKFMAVFSMLFGASTGLMCDQLQKRQQPVLSIYSKRLLVLMLFGLVHAYLIWHGDILVFYAICGILPCLMRNLKWQIIISIALLILFLGGANSYFTWEYISSLPIANQLTIAEQHFVGLITVSEAELNGFKGDWIEQQKLRQLFAFHFHTDVFLSWGVWRVSGLMLLGLALYRAGFIVGNWSNKQYFLALVVCLPVGLTLAYIGLEINTAEAWKFPNYFFKNNLWNYSGSILVALGYISLLTLIHKQSNMVWLISQFQLIGRTALSNYILQSVICSILFYGLGLYGELDRIWAPVIIVCVWTIQLMVTRRWLKVHSQGPLEALWKRIIGR